ncbi:alpha/beta fold hydrolase, partial [Roseibium sp.]|uniref:alpha/beta fold hydrolase n=1 Tax=Roseibium sp. TaxID=1936156 RepID=UPI003D0CA137
MADVQTGRTEGSTNRRSSFGARALRVTRNLFIVIAVAYAMAAGYMYLNQRSFVFLPTGDLSLPAEKGLDGVSVETVAMADGTEVTVWKAAPSLEGAPTVLYLHGNSRNVSARWKRFKQILDSGFGLYAPSYRGYAGSGGSPSEAALISDALEHYDRAARDGAPIILHGESLGTGVATAVA